MSGAAKQPADLFGQSPKAAPKTAREDRAEAAGELYVDVALQRPMRNAFTYRVPLPLRDSVQPGFASPFRLGREKKWASLLRSARRP
ncbi:MAG: hypothetical protein AAF368_17765, partial [Planctomycetota bacterium]